MAGMRGLSSFFWGCGEWRAPILGESCCGLSMPDAQSHSTSEPVKIQMGYACQWHTPHPNNHLLNSVADTPWKQG